VVWWLSAAIVAGVTQRYGAGFFVGIAAALGVGRGRTRRAAAFLLAVACVVHGAVASDRLDRARDRLRAAGPRLSLEGRVADFPSTHTYGTECAFDASLDGGPVRLRLRLTRFDVHYGDRMRVHAVAVETRTPLRALFAQGLVGVARAGYGDVVLLERGGGGLRGGLWRVHRAARVRLSRRLGSRAGLPLALLIGERGLVDGRTRAAFSALGITHLLALSGMHLGILAAMAWWAMRRRGARRRAMLTTLAVLLAVYVGVVGDVVSLRRALVMALVLIAGRGLERPADPVAALGRALFALLALWPPVIYSVGFQLSFAATFAVIVVVTHLPTRPQHGLVRRVLADAAIAPVASAGVLAAVAPLQLAYFGMVSAMSPLATVAFLPPVAAMLVGGGVAALLADVPGAGRAACAALGVLGEVTARSAGALAAHGSWALRFPVPDMPVYYAGLALAWWGRRRVWPVAVGIALCALAFRLGRS